ncbi:PREDICTED: metaxin-1 [Calidris pugnax]|uniref:metaxin-1 n=1 Tax=Calidris pugnax TaxID=198806 RepID=UPI00071DEDD4|nr:PREDICTED: metaxin-1 [Calidris pugnax]
MPGAGPRGSACCKPGGTDGTGREFLAHRAPGGPRKPRGLRAPPSPGPARWRSRTGSAEKDRFHSLAHTPCVPVPPCPTLYAPHHIHLSLGFMYPHLSVGALHGPPHPWPTAGWHHRHRCLQPPLCLPPGRLPALKTRDEGTISKTQQIITHLRKQKYNADYDLSATQGADTLAFVSLLEEKLLPVLIHTFWVDAKNYVEHTRKWYAETIPFPLNFFLPNSMHKQHLERLQLMWGDGYMEDEEKLEKELYRDARECLTLLSQRLGSQKFFFGDSPASLDAFVFSRLAPLLKAKLPNGKLQQHLKSLQNLCNYCTSILSLYFPWDGGEPPASAPRAAGADGGEVEEDPHKRRNQLLSVLVGLVAMLGYAFLSGIVSIQRGGGAGPAGRQPIALAEEEEEEEE